MMDSGHKMVAICAVSLGVVMLAVVICAAVHNVTMSTEAIRAGLQQSESGHWVKADLNKERGDDAR